MQDWIAWVSAAAVGASVAAGAWVWLRQRRRMAHARTVAVAIAAACEDATARIHADQANGDWARTRAQTLKQVRRVLATERRALKRRVDERVDGDFFKAALRASVGRHRLVDKPEWVAEFNTLSSGVIDQVLRPRHVSSQCASLLNKGLAATRARWTPKVTDPDALASSDALIRSGLPSLRCDDTLLDALTSAGALGGVVLSGMALGAGVPVKALELAGKVLTHDVFQDLVLTWVFDELVETVGEEVIEEVVTAVAAAFTGIGALFTLYKLGKWGWKLKKLLVDHEHLVALRTQVLDACLAEHDRLAAHVLAQVTQELDRTPERALARLQKLTDHAAALALQV